MKRRIISGKWCPQHSWHLCTDLASSLSIVVTLLEFRVLIAVLSIVLANRSLLHGFWTRPHRPIVFSPKTLSFGYCNSDFPSIIVIQPSHRNCTHDNTHVAIQRSIRRTTQRTRGAPTYALAYTSHITYWVSEWVSPHGWWNIGTPPICTTTVYCDELHVAICVYLFKRYH